MLGFCCVCRGTEGQVDPVKDATQHSSDLVSMYVPDPVANHTGRKPRRNDPLRMKLISLKRRSHGDGLNTALEVSKRAWFWLQRSNPKLLELIEEETCL
jgi:hypothetical protein